MRRQISERGGMTNRTTVSDTGLRVSALTAFSEPEAPACWGGGGDSHGLPEMVSFVRRMESISEGNQRSLLCARFSSCKAFKWEI